jgi:phospholipase D-like protein/putative oligomerization/nucleic acid binding protein
VGPSALFLAAPPVVSSEPTYALAATHSCSGDVESGPTCTVVGTTTRWRFQMFNDNGSFLLAMFEFFIFFAWIMCLFYVFGDIFRSRDMGGGGKTLWCLFIIFLPFLGFFAYLIARGGGMTQRSIDQQQRLQQQQDEHVRSVVATSGAGSSADQIASAKRLLDEGTINQAEFDQMKAKVLASA